MRNQIWLTCLDTDIQWRFQNLRHFMQRAQSEGLWFSHYQNNHMWFLGAFVTYNYSSPSMKINTCKIPHGAQRLWMYFVSCVVGEHLKAQFEPHGWGRYYTRPGIPCISVVIGKNINHYNTHSTTLHLKLVSLNTFNMISRVLTSIACCSCVELDET